MNILYVYRKSACRRQKGMVLIISLLVLVAMTLASIGLVRSVDTSTLAVANLALRQTADEAALIAIEWEIRRIEDFAQTNIDQFNSNFAAGYYAAIQANESTKGIPRPLQTMQDTGVNRYPEDRLGNTARVVVERLCSQGGSVDGSICVLAGWAEGEQSIIDGHDANKDYGEMEFGLGSPLAALRITARVDGPRNVVSYAQSIIILR
jgi:hypothetical protein